MFQTCDKYTENIRGLLYYNSDSHSSDYHGQYSPTTTAEHAISSTDSPPTTATEHAISSTDSSITA